MNLSSLVDVRSDGVQRILCVLLICFSTFLVFDGVIKGKHINNSAYLFAFEPWAHHITPRSGVYNNVLSDDIDAMSVSYPTRDLLSKGEFTFWNRYWQLGIPELRIDSGWFYPLRILWILFGIPLGMTLEVLLRFMAGGVFTFLLLELIGIRRVIALVCAVGYAFGANSIGDYMYGFGPPGLTLPIVLYCIERVIRLGGRKDVVFLTLSLILLNTHIMVHVNALISMWVGFYAFLRVMFEKFPIRAVKNLCIAVIFAPLIFAVALLPTLDFYTNYFNDSYREGYSVAQLRVQALLMLFFNKFFGEPLLEAARYKFGTYVNTGIFIGYLAGVLGLACSLLRVVFKRDSMTLLVTFISGILLLTMYEFSFESTESIFGYIPLLKFIRPFYQKPVLQFFLLILGALGLDYFWRLRKAWSFQFVMCLLMMIVVQAVGTYYFIYYNNIIGPSKFLESYFVIFSSIHLILFAALVLGHPLIKEKIGGKLGKSIFGTCCLLIIGLTVYESTQASKKWIPYAPKKSFYPKTETTDFVLKNLGSGRVITLDRAAVPGLLYGNNIPVAAGRSLPRTPYLELLRMAYPGIYKDHPTQSLFSSSETDFAHPIWRLFAVTYFISGLDLSPTYVDEKFGDKIIVHSFNDGRVLERKDGSKGYVAAYNIAISDDIEQTKKLISSGLDLDRTIVVGKDQFEASSVDVCDDNIVKVRKFQVLSDYVGATIRNKCPAYFMVSMFYDKGWRVYVDGQEQPIKLAYGFMPVVKIDNPGKHRVEFKYMPLGFVYGGIISLLSLLVFLLILFKPKATSG